MNDNNRIFRYSENSQNVSIKKTNHPPCRIDTKSDTQTNRIYIQTQNIFHPKNETPIQYWYQKTFLYLFQVSIVAASSCRYLYWQRASLEYLFVKETYLATVVTTLIARDITTKLYAMNNKIVTEKGSHLDIRLPSITGAIAATVEYRSPPKVLKAKQLLGNFVLYFFF